MHEEMGDRRPTQIHRHLRTLADQSVPSDFLRTLWTKRLPPNIQAIIVTQVEAPQDDVAQLVDKIAEVTRSPWVAPVSSSSAEICTLTARIDELTRQVAALASNASLPRSLSRTRPQARRSTRSAGRSPASDICWYHRRFKEHAKKCSPRQFRHLKFIGQFSTDFKHVTERDNAVADALPRANSVMSPLDYPAIARSQDQDAELKDILQHGSALRLERVHIPGTDVCLYCETSTSQPLPFITTPF